MNEDLPADQSLEEAQHDEFAVNANEDEDEFTEIYVWGSKFTPKPNNYR